MTPPGTLAYVSDTRNGSFFGEEEMKEPHLLYDLQGHVARLTLNRPEVKNAFSEEMLTLWHRSLLRAKEDPEVRVLVVTGKGDTFCSGGDVRTMGREGMGPLEMKRYLWEGVHRIALALEDLDKPVIAAVNGAALGAGMDMALMCDIRICSDRARLAESYIHLGLVPGDGGAYFLPRLAGLPKALELLMTGEVLTPDQALSLGIVNRVVPHASLMEETYKLAFSLARKPPMALAMIKRAVYQAQRSTLRDHLDYISSQVALLCETREHKEAVDAFLSGKKGGEGG